MAFHDWFHNLLAPKLSLFSNIVSDKPWKIRTQLAGYQSLIVFRFDNHQERYFDVFDHPAIRLKILFYETAHQAWRGLRWGYLAYASNNGWRSTLCHFKIVFRHMTWGQLFSTSNVLFSYIFEVFIMLTASFHHVVEVHCLT